MLNRREASVAFAIVALGLYWRSRRQASSRAITSAIYFSRTSRSSSSRSA